MATTTHLLTCTTPRSLEHETGGCFLATHCRPTTPRSPNVTQELSSRKSAKRVVMYIEHWKEKFSSFWGSKPSKVSGTQGLIAEWDFELSGMAEIFLVRSLREMVRLGSSSESGSSLSEVGSGLSSG